MIVRCGRISRYKNLHERVEYSRIEAPAKGRPKQCLLPEQGTTDCTNVGYRKAILRTQCLLKRQVPLVGPGQLQVWHRNGHEARRQGSERRRCGITVGQRKGNAEKRLRRCEWI